MGFRAAVEGMGRQPMGRAAGQMMQIGDVALHTGLSLRTVRYYEETGLVVPRMRTSGGFRLYSTAEIERLEMVKQLKPLGFSLEEMREILQLLDVLHVDSADECARAKLGEHARTVEDHCRVLERQLSQAKDIAATLQRISAGHSALDDSPDV